MPGNRTRRPPERYNELPTRPRRQRQTGNGMEPNQPPPAAETRAIRRQSGHETLSASNPATAPGQTSALAPTSAQAQTPTSVPSQAPSSAQAPAPASVHELATAPPTTTHLNQERDSQADFDDTTELDIVQYLRHQLRLEREQHQRKIQEILANAAQTAQAIPQESLARMSIQTPSKPPRFTRSFDGTTNYRAFRTFFQTAAERRNWTEEDQLDNIMNALTGLTSEIVAEVAETGPLTFSRLDVALLIVYGTEKTTDELERESHAVKQTTDETPRAFATRLDRTGRKAMRGFPEERIQAALKKAFLFGLRDHAQAAMLNLTNAATLDDLLSTIQRGHAELAISSIIEPLMKKAKINHTDVEIPAASNGSVAVKYPHRNPVPQPHGQMMEEGRSIDRKRANTSGYPAPGGSRRRRDGGSSESKRELRCFACEGKHTLKNCMEYNEFLRQRTNSRCAAPQGWYSQPPPPLMRAAPSATDTSQPAMPFVPAPQRQNQGN